MYNKGIVTGISNGTLTIVFERQEACGDCHACMHGSSNCKKHTIYINGEAELGDEVVVEIDDTHIVAASAAAYLIPLSGFIVGLFIGWMFAKTNVLNSINNELIMTFFSIVGTALAYLIMRLLDPVFSKGKWKPRIVSINHK